MTLHANLNFIASTTASDSPASYLSAATINNSISTHCEIITPSQITPRKLTRVSNNVSDRCRSCEQAIHPCKKKQKKQQQRSMVGSVLPLHLSVCAYQPLEESLIHTDPLLTCPADAAAAAAAKTLFLPDSMTTRVSVKEWVGTLKLSTLQSGIK